MSVSRESNWIITLTSGFFQFKIENICLFRLIKKHGNVFENWLCPNFLLLPKKPELPKIWGGCSPPRPAGPYAYVCTPIYYFIYTWYTTIYILYSPYIEPIYVLLRMLHSGAKIWILFSSSKTIIYERVQLVSKILFLPRENKIHIFNPPFSLLYRQKDIDKIVNGNYQNYVIDKLTCKTMENKPLGPRM